MYWVQARRGRRGALAVCVLGCSLLLAGRAAHGGYVAIDLYTLGKSVVIEGQSQAAAGGQVVGAAANHALLWNGSAVATDLNPTNLAGITSSSAVAADGTQQVGYGYGATASVTNALVWSGTASSAVNLNPNGFTSSYAYGAGGGQQVGYASGPSTNGNSHAFAWNGSASQATDLQPTNVQNVSASVAIATNGSRQVGLGIMSGQSHAMLWNGSNDSAVDLNPTAKGVVSSTAYDISPEGHQQVGSGNVAGGPLHAMVWDDTADSMVDLHPLLGGFISSEVYATNGIQQVGDGFLQLSLECGCTDRHALVWSGSANSVVDLQNYLPSNFTHSDAFGIDSSGNVYGLAWDPDTGLHAVEWAVTATPEPAALSVLCLGALGLMRRQCRASAR
jgi:hypothetical protein